MTTSAPSEDVILDALVDAGVVSAEALRLAAARRDAEGEDASVLFFLISGGCVQPAAALDLLARLHGVHTIDLTAVEPSPDALALVSGEDVRRLGALPVARLAGHSLQVAIADPFPLSEIEELERIVRAPVQAILADQHSLRSAIARFYPSAASVREISAAASEEADADDQDTLDVEASQAKVPRAVMEILTDGVRLRASDIHIEFYGHGRVRYRIDGSMVERPEALAERFQRRIINRIKYLAGMDLGQDRVPDNGAITTTIDGRRIQFRVSTLPTIYGEKVVLRILENSELALDLGELGLEPEDLRTVRDAASRRDRMVLVTGPTGSGKSTLIYALLAELNRPDRNLVTIEDPVERRIAGINQVNIQGRVGEDDRTRLSFARVLTDVLRQDPDILMVGEIRDHATAETATRAAITGHSVLSTLHTTDTVATIARLRGLGIPDYAIVDTVALVVAQRLVRTICHQCAEDVTASDAVLLLAEFPDDLPRTFRRGRGCARCNQTGFTGRTAIHELLPMSGPLRQAIISGRSPDELRDVARSEGLVSLRDRALALAARGRTTIEEALYSTPAPE